MSEKKEKPALDNLNNQLLDNEKAFNEIADIMNKRRLKTYEIEKKIKINNTDKVDKYIVESEKECDDLRDYINQRRKQLIK